MLNINLHKIEIDIQINKPKSCTNLSRLCNKTALKKIKWVTLEMRFLKLVSIAKNNYVIYCVGLQKHCNFEEYYFFSPNTCAMKLDHLFKHFRM